VRLLSIGAFARATRLTPKALRLYDRYLLCSDGLTTVVSTEVIRDTLRGVADPEQAAARLIDAANAGGGPDNVSCVVADIIPLVRHVTA